MAQGRAVSAAEFCEAVGVRASDLPSLEVAGLPTASRREGKATLTVYPYPACVRWYIEHAVKTRPRGIPPRANQRDFAALIGLSTRQVGNLTAENVFATQPEDGKRWYALPLCVHQFIDYKVKTASHAEDKLSELDQARLRKTSAEAQKAEFELLEVKGELLRRPKVLEAIAELLTGIRGFMTTIPNAWAPELRGVRGEVELRMSLKRIVKDGLSQLSKGAAQVGKRIQQISASEDMDEEDAPDGADRLAS